MEEAFSFQKEPGIEKREKSAGGGAYGSTKNAIGRYRPQPPDEEETQRCVQQISADIVFMMEAVFPYPSCTACRMRVREVKYTARRARGLYSMARGR